MSVITIYCGILDIIVTLEGELKILQKIVVKPPETRA